MKTTFVGRRTYKFEDQGSVISRCGTLALVLAGLFAFGLIVFSAFSARVKSNSELAQFSSHSTYNSSLPLSSSNRLKVAVCVLITKEPEASGGFLDAAGTLAFSIEAAHSIHEITLRALIHSSVSQRTSEILEFLGFEVIRRESPVSSAEVRNAESREHMLSDGCCGMRELMKLWVWTWTSFDAVLSLDADFLFHRNFDDIFQLLFKEKSNANLEISRVDRSYPPVDAWRVAPTIAASEPYTLGWTHGASFDTGNELMNGGFLVVRPNLKDFNEILEILREGDFRNDGTAWRGSKVAWTYGGRTIQGVIPYYYFQIRADAHLELPRCKYNNMVETSGCRQWPLEAVVSNHFTWCQKPWYCISQGVELCEQFTAEWWKTNRHLEAWLQLTERPKCPKRKYAAIQWENSPRFKQWKARKHSDS